MTDQAGGKPEAGHQIVILWQGANPLMTIPTRTEMEIARETNKLLDS